ncbi:MAG: hypothetical protein RBS33_13620 [Lentimicrobium sp.]|mgnify:CR=1 FL=1|jgi:hypothetical protein|nr:hypothetical protein [Lentimicrobiaceae bacterium]MDY0027022.1 hypothetical protein [Lentimicrobium sp.]
MAKKPCPVSYVRGGIPNDSLIAFIDKDDWVGGRAASSHPNHPQVV